MHYVRFPKTLTIELPELLREGFQQLSNRELQRGTAELLEAVLATGLRAEVLLYPEALDETYGESDEPGPTPGTFETVEPLHLTLNSKQRERVLRIIRDSSSRTPEELAMWMLEWGLDAFEENLKLIVVLVLYAAATVLEHFDAEISAVVRVSGHTLTHLVAAAATYLVLDLLTHRRLRPESTRSPA